MPWKESCRVSLRQEFINMMLKEQISFLELCNRFSISRKTGYKWVHRYSQEGLPGLEDLSRAPKKRPKKSSLNIEQAVVDLRLKYPTWGGRKIRRKLMDNHFTEIPSPSTITDILHRYNLIGNGEKKLTSKFIRFERSHPNDLWQMDFKGPFKLVTGQKCEPLTILDDHSRYNICLEAGESIKREYVQKTLEKVFRRYGLPWQMTMDNGNPWGSYPHGKYTRLSVWLMKLGIKVSYSRPYHPQTQGKLERFHRSLKADVLQYRNFESYKSCQQSFDKYRQLYNNDRPHEALNYEVPSTRYNPSLRSYPEKIKGPEYDENDRVLKVRSQGSIYYDGKEYRVGKGFIGEYISVKERETRLDIYFGSFKVKEYKKNN